MHRPDSQNCLKHLVAILKNSNKDVITRQEAFQFFAAYVHRMTFEEKLAEIDAFAQVVVDIILDLTANQDITTKQDGRAR